MILLRLGARLLPWLLTTILLGGCTGTQEESIPILLVVGSVEAGAPQLQLFEDVRDPMTPRDLQPVGTPVPLPAAPVSFDVIDRNGERSELVVLTEAGTLHFFDLSDLPDSFVQSRTPVDAAALVLASGEAVGPAFCWRQVQVGGEPSAAGRYAALLDSCRSDLTEVYVLDLVTSEFLYALSLRHVDAQPLLAVGIHLDQASDRLFFATDEFTETLVQSVEVAGEAAPEELGLSPLDPLEAVDLAPLGSGIGLLGEGGELSIVPFTGDAPAPVDLELAAARTLLPDPSGNVELVAAFAESRGALVDILEDQEPESLDLAEPLADATLEPVQRFAYLLEEGGIEVLDLFSYADPPANRLRFFDLAGLEDPRVITWAFGNRLP